MVVDDNDFVYSMLLHEYFSIGTTGIQAINALWDDIANGRMDQTASDWEVTVELVIMAASRLTKDIVDSGEYATFHNGTNGQEIRDRITVTGNLNINWVPPF